MAVSTTSVRRRGITGHWPRCFVTARRFIQWAVSAAQAGGGHGRGPAVASGGRRVPLLRSWNGSLGRGVVAGQPGFGSHWSRANAVVNSWVQGHVAKLVEPPRTDNRELKPWTLDETLDFLAASRGDPLYAAFVLAIAMGLRRGEIIGLRWSDLDLDNRVLHVRQQTQRRRGVLYDDDPKSRRRRAVPLRALCIAPLRWHRMRQSAARAKAGEGAGIRRRLHHPHRPPGRAAERLSLLHPHRRLRRHPSRPAARRPARHGHPPPSGRSRVPRRDGDPRAQSDQHHHGRLHARRPGHAARGHESHGSAAQEASRSFSDRAR